jgi:cation diffusion facilitator CzcD-associated flavoprotein CzcO
MTVLAPPTVGVIGCGPGGMSFLHAIATRRRKLEEDGDEEGLSKLPIISVFERSSTAGGVWKSSKDDSPGALTSSSIFPQDVKITDEDGTKDVVTTKEDDTEISVTGTSISSASSNQNDDVHDDDASGVVVEDNDYIIGKKVDSSTSMYEALWTNGPNQVIEYPDYTFKEHFKQALPIYLPRGALLEYMMARVTKNNPNFFDDVRFNTTVNNVSYDEVQKKFVFMLMDNISGERRVEYFDKCIWAAGLNGCAKIPRSIRTTLHEGGFKGIDIHSSEAGDVLGNFKDKQIVLIGDAFSAEDIALQAVKLGVKKVRVLNCTLYCYFHCDYIAHLFSIRLK